MNVKKQDLPFKNKKNLRYIIFIVIILLASGYCIYNFVINSNFHEVIPGKVYRSGQPSPSQLIKWIKKYGIKTIINLRAKKPEDIEMEKQVTDRLGVKLMPIYLSGNRLISSAELMDLIETIETAETPVLLHCQSGIDRAGTASALACIAIGKIDFESAVSQAYVPPGPWKRKDYSNRRADYIHNYAHISDTLKLYENDCERLGLDKNDWEQFMQWAVDLGPIEDLNIEYKNSYSYFPFLSKDKQFFPIRKLFIESYIQFSIQILFIILWIFLSIKIIKKKSQ